MPQIAGCGALVCLLVSSEYASDKTLISPRFGLAACCTPRSCRPAGIQVDDAQWLIDQQPQHAQRGHCTRFETCNQYYEISLKVLGVSLVAFPMSYFFE